MLKNIGKHLKKSLVLAKFGAKKKPKPYHIFQSLLLYAFYPLWFGNHWKAGSDSRRLPFSQKLSPQKRPHTVAFDPLCQKHFQPKNWSLSITWLSTDTVHLQRQRILL